MDRRRLATTTKNRLLANIMAGLPGAYARYDVPGLRDMLDRYRGIAPTICAPISRGSSRRSSRPPRRPGCGMCIHPDDPPRPLFGLPRIVLDRRRPRIIARRGEQRRQRAHACTGSLGARAANDLPAIATRLRAAHPVRPSAQRRASDPDGSFSESDHLDGDVDMVARGRRAADEQGRRKAAGDAQWRIPFRPDHGHELLDDAAPTHPGYPPSAACAAWPRSAV